MNYKLKKCSECGSEFKQYNSLVKHCSNTCKSKTLKIGTIKKVPIKKFSKQRLIESPKYTLLRKEFLSKPENSKCFIDGCNRKANTIEHTRGRRGYADEWAKENKITLYIDVRFFKPCCIQHNLELENNPELSKKYQLSKITGKPKE